MWKVSKNRYKGEWQNDRPHGIGTKVWPDGAKYVGAWKDGMRHGFGEFDGMTTMAPVCIVGTGATACLTVLACSQKETAHVSRVNSSAVFAMAMV